MENVAVPISRLHFNLSSQGPVGVIDRLAAKATAVDRAYSRWVARNCVSHVPGPCFLRQQWPGIPKKCFKLAAL